MEEDPHVVAPRLLEQRPGGVDVRGRERPVEVPGDAVEERERRVLVRADEVRFEAARKPRQHSAQDERDHLVAGDVDALAQRRQLVLPDGGPGAAQPAAGEAPDHEEDHRQRTVV